MHETSKRLSQTMRDIYEPDWNGVEELPVITEVSLGEIYVGEIYRRDLSSHSLTVRAFGLLELLEKKDKCSHNHPPYRSSQGDFCA